MLTHTQVEAHKLILAASGPFFHAILKKNKHSHPLVFMRVVKLEGLVNLVCSESGTKSFVESETLESEIEERCTGEKPFVCTQCSYSSTTADAFANPFRRKTFQLHTVWILLHKGILPQETHVGAFRREAFQVWPVELFMRSGYYASSEASNLNTH